LSAAKLQPSAVRRGVGIELVMMGNGMACVRTLDELPKRAADLCGIESARNLIPTTTASCCCR